MALDDTVRRLARRAERRAEATIQADVRQVLLDAPLNLEADDIFDVPLEAQVGDGRRIDVQLGATVIEVKRDIRAASTAEKAVEQLAGYVLARQEQTGQGYVGVLTDGCLWKCYHLRAGCLVEVTTLQLREAPTDTSALCDWLDGVLATAHDVEATPDEIMRRLGEESSAHAVDRAALTALYAEHRDTPTVAMKRRLWARLLVTALGTQFEDSDELFVEHTLLVNSAEVIAHAVLGLPLAAVGPASLLSGAMFEEAGVHGVVEADFFDWVVEVPGGEAYVRSLCRRLSRFRWTDVHHDVLKVLYESVIGPETRKRLGEYYTPDWLAEAVIESSIAEPLRTRTLDPACGSGTFLFHAVRRYLSAADDAGQSLELSLTNLVTHVQGVDLHPVAVTLARVTYILAIGRDRLTSPGRPPIRVPVYLGDSLQWTNEKQDLLDAGYLVVPTAPDGDLFARDLKFPDELLQDDQRFDELVHSMAVKAGLRSPGSPMPSILPTLNRLGIRSQHHAVLEATFKEMCRLHDEGRDHIWGYYIRNLARPMWLAKEENRVDLLMGNPPWLAYRHMTQEMQSTFRNMSKSRRLWHGAKVATHQDLSALFIIRAVQLYLKAGGRFAMVVPNAVLDRQHYQGFREALYPDASQPVRIEFDEPWDLRRIRPHIFPRGAAVVFGRRSSNSVPMPTHAECWEGASIVAEGRWEDHRLQMTRARKALAIATDDPQSPYHTRFAQGAVCVPRVLFTVERRPTSPLGHRQGTIPIQSRRSTQEKAPWNKCESLVGVLESQFVRPLLLGETVLPFRLADPLEAVVPWDGKQLLHGGLDALDHYPGLASWWRSAEATWMRLRRSKRLTLIEQLDYRGKCSRQFPIQPVRVVYGKAGMHLCAAKVTSSRAVVDTTLYWTSATTDAEADYLCAVLNAPCVTELVRPLMSYGKDERDIHKHVWKLAIPEFDPSNPAHAAIAQDGHDLAKLTADVELDQTRHFASIRRDLRGLISKHACGIESDARVRELLSM